MDPLFNSTGFCKVKDYCRQEHRCDYVCTDPQAAQTHYMNADVTLACERCCVTNGYLQRLV